MHTFGGFRGQGIGLQRVGAFQALAWCICKNDLARHVVTSGGFEPTEQLSDSFPGIHLSRPVEHHNKKEMEDSLKGQMVYEMGLFMPYRSWNDPHIWNMHIHHRTSRRSGKTTHNRLHTAKRQAEMIFSVGISDRRDISLIQSGMLGDNK